MPAGLREEADGLYFGFLQRKTSHLKGGQPAPRKNPIFRACQQPSQHGPDELGEISEELPVSVVKWWNGYAIEIHTFRVITQQLLGFTDNGMSDPQHVRHICGVRETARA